MTRLLATRLTAVTAVAAGAVALVVVRSPGGMPDGMPGGTSTGPAGGPPAPPAAVAAAPTAPAPATPAPATPAPAIRGTRSPAAPSGEVPADTVPRGTVPEAAPPPPPTTAGPLRARNLPRAGQLGRAWRPYVDPGGVEAGFVGNGSWVRARSPRDTVEGLVPVGCVGFVPPPLPAPRRVLEGTYAAPGGGRGVALVLDYATPVGAERLLDGVRAIVAGCRAPARGTGGAPLTLTVTPVRSGPSVVVDERREHGAGAAPDVWTEVVVRTGRRVGLLSVSRPPGRPRPDARGLERAIRARLRS